MRIIHFLMVAVVALTAMPAAAATITPEGEAAAAIGTKWLTLLDEQKYEESWKQAGSMFREQVSEEQWLGALKASRGPLGGLVSRKATRVDFTTTLRGAPDGEYCIIHYTTELKAKTITERLTLVKEDGAWQVSAYAIH